ncbi:YeiH family protein [Gilvimarinus agarilyticus]|uniref:YeiH family protein n=1 Tax=Gilvimarinus agarilyticus TaxID=679259 RepID=UPI0005A3009C|nr:putative sulfate exporter family transporter [Gilvimarinus agarilyticus]
MWFILLALACLALLIAQLPAFAAVGLGALPVAILLGMLLGNTTRIAERDTSQSALRFCQQKLLRLGVVLLGFSLSLQQLLEAGWQVLVLDLVVVVTVLCLGTYVGVRWLKMSVPLALLTSVGSAVCGASAIMAVEPVLKARERDISLAVATVVTFGSLAMFSYPLLFQFIEVDSVDYGIYIGATVHEVAQAVAAGQSIDPLALQGALVAKLARVMLLAPVVFVLGLYWQRQKDHALTEQRALIIPWFVLGFIAAACARSVLPMAESLLQALGYLSQAALALAMVALGVKTRWALLLNGGGKPFFLAGVLWVLLLGGGFFLVPIVLSI